LFSSIVRSVTAGSAIQRRSVKASILPTPTHYHRYGSPSFLDRRNGRQNAEPLTSRLRSAGRLDTLGMPRLARLMPTALDADRADPTEHRRHDSGSVCKRAPEHWRASTQRCRARAECPECTEDRSADEQINTDAIDAIQDRATTRHFVPGIFISTPSNGL
jgi:hypothetical protein